jgi:hypothetical protein
MVFDLQSVFGAIFVGIAIIHLIAIWNPNMRGRWKGTAIQVGPTACAGIFFGFGGVGLVFIFRSPTNSPLSIMLGSTVFFGLILVIVGSYFDK